MIIRATTLAVLTLLTSVTPFASVDTPVFGDARPYDPHAPEFAGIWRTDGYGHVFELGETGLRVFHATARACVEMSDEDAADAVDFDYVRLNRDGSVLRLSNAFVPYEYQVRRIESLPASCLDPTPDTPIGNFEAFTSYFAEHYAFFDLYGVDWPAEIAAARTQVTPGMEDQALFNLLSGMLANVEDAHVRIVAEVDGQRAFYRIDQGKTLTALNTNAERAGDDPREARREFQRRFWVDDIQETLLEGESIIAGNDRIQYGIVSGDIGYLAFLTEGGFSDAGFSDAGGSYREDLPILDATLDHAMALFDAHRVKAVIIDLSVNFGGYDFVGRAIAGRFAADRVPAYSKYAADNPGAEPFTFYIEPAVGQRFTGPVYLLTSDITISGGETLALSLRSLPNVTHAGERTRGALSDVLYKHLPNGWTVTISNEIYTDPAGIVWEGEGIRPEIEIPVFDAASPPDGHPEAVRRLIELIDERPD